MDKNLIVVTSRVRLARNLKAVPFPSMLKGSRASAEIVLNAVRKVCDRLFAYDLQRMDNLSDIDRVALLERHIISNSLVANTENGVVIIGKGDSNGVSVMVNEEDHIRAQCVMRGYGLIECYSEVSEFDDNLASVVEVAFDNKLGYLTACPSNLGTGMRASVMLFLPALTHSGEIDRISKAINNAGLTVRGAYGEGSDASGYLYQISNQVTIGISEVDIIAKVISVVDKVCDAEGLARHSWLKKEGVLLEDMIMRSYGVLQFARKMSSKEFLIHISNVKLGASLDMIDLDVNMLNTITELCQPANLCHYGGRALNQVERDVLRAKLIRDAIKLR